MKLKRYTLYYADVKGCLYVCLMKGYFLRMFENLSEDRYREHSELRQGN
jgi:hypothetical protein